MKIGHLDPKAAVPQVAQERKDVGKPAEATKDDASAKVALSSAASALQVGSHDASFDGAKVERIAQAIRDGKFEINAEAIADKLISNAQELLGKSSR